MNAILNAINASPIDRVAARVASQRYCIDSIDASRADLELALERMLRKQRLLKRVIGITKKTQHKNLKERLKRNVLTMGSSNPRAVVEYIQNGELMKEHYEALGRFKVRQWKSKWMPLHRANAAEHGYYLVEKDD